MTGITAAQKLQEVSALLAVPNSRIIAGGTTFSQNTEEDLHPVSISGLEGLDSIKQKGSRIEIGPLVKLNTLAENDLIRACAPALAEAAGNVGTPEVRSRGTLGGNLAGDRVGDTAAALLACGAKLTIKTDSDYREILIDRFWNPAGKNDLQYDEWITRITIQIPGDPYTGAAFGKYGVWGQTSEPNAAAAVRLCLDGNGRVSAIRGGLRLGPSFIRRMFPLEKALKNRAPTEENVDKAVCSMLSAVQGQIGEEAFSAFLKDIVQRSLIMAQERRAL